MHQSNSSSLIPFHAKTGTPVAAIAAAAWSWVEKMLQLDHRTWAPSAVNVSISTAVWIVMCRQPAILAPAKGWLAPYFSRSDISPGISVSASSISRRPHSASDMSATLQGSRDDSAADSEEAWGEVVDMPILSSFGLEPSR